MSTYNTYVIIYGAKAYNGRYWIEMEFPSLCKVLCITLVWMDIPDLDSTKNNFVESTTIRNSEFTNLYSPPVYGFKDYHGDDIAMWMTQVYNLKIGYLLRCSEMWATLTPGHDAPDFDARWQLVTN